MNHAGTVKEQESSPRARRLCSLARALLLVLSLRILRGRRSGEEAPELQTATPTTRTADVPLSCL